MKIEYKPLMSGRFSIAALLMAVISLAGPLAQKSQADLMPMPPSSIIGGDCSVSPLFQNQYYALMARIAADRTLVVNTRAEVMNDATQTKTISDGLESLGQDVANSNLSVADQIEVQKLIDKARIVGTAANKTILNLYNALVDIQKQMDICTATLTQLSQEMNLMYYQCRTDDVAAQSLTAVAAALTGVENSVNGWKQFIATQFGSSTDIQKLISDANKAYQDAQNAFIAKGGSPSGFKMPPALP